MFLFDAENPQMTRDLATEIFANADGSTGNKVAQEGAKAWLKVIEDLRQRFNAPAATWASWNTAMCRSRTTPRACARPAAMPGCRR
jgi:hypothetical protein